jgi:hypothetical protein
MMLVAMPAATRGTDHVADAPVAVVITVRRVIAPVVIDAAFHAHAGYRASR